MVFSRRLTIVVVLALALACVAVVGHKLSARLRAPSAEALPVSPCDPSVQDCVVPLPGGRTLTLTIAPKPVRALEKLSVEVRVTEVRAGHVAIDFDGVDMSMGFNRAELSGNDGRFSGDAMLPVCVTGSMTWRATVFVTEGERTVAVPFHFKVAGHKSE